MPYRLVGIVDFPCPLIWGLAKGGAQLYLAPKMQHHCANCGIGSEQETEISNSPSERILPDRDQADAAKPENATQFSLKEWDILNRRLTSLETEIARERRNPLLQIGAYVAFQVLSRLGRFSPPISWRRAARFEKSALKRHPDRSLSDRSFSEAEAQTADIGKSRFSGKQVFDASKKTILVVSHDASWSGAPILALNLIQSLSGRYNIIALVLGGGQAMDNFRSTSCAVYSVERIKRAAYEKFIGQICRNHPLAFAVVNSVESRYILRSLKVQAVPTVTLIHEFASYVAGSDRQSLPFVKVFEESDEVVFSTRRTLEAAQAQTPGLDMAKAHILPQGRCSVPESNTSESERKKERDWLQEALRPNGREDGRIVIIGAGTVILRKGVDLFIEMATRVLQMPGSENIHFYWIGANYDPVRDFSYSIYLKDQIDRSGIGARMTMLRETAEIDLAYRLADMLVLSSRLDPLPNVTIDAMSCGLPVVCFDKASGMVELLETAGLKENCVASYIDTRGLAEKVLALASDPQLRAEVAERSRKFAATAFDFDIYARKIETLGLNAAKKRASGLSLV